MDVDIKCVQEFTSKWKCPIFWNGGGGDGIFFLQVIIENNRTAVLDSKQKKEKCNGNSTKCRRTRLYMNYSEWLHISQWELQWIATVLCWNFLETLLLFWKADIHLLFINEMSSVLLVISLPEWLLSGSLLADNCCIFRFRIETWIEIIQAANGTKRSTSATSDDNEAIDSGADVLPWQRLGWRRPHGSGLLCMRRRLNNRELSSPCRSVSPLCGLVLARESVLKACCGRVQLAGMFPVAQNEATMEALMRESVNSSCLVGPQILKFIPNEAQQKLSALPAARVNVCTMVSPGLQDAASSEKPGRSLSWTEPRWRPASPAGAREEHLMVWGTTWTWSPRQKHAGNT